MRDLRDNAVQKREAEAGKEPVFKPGKTTRTQQLTVQRKSATAAEAESVRGSRPAGGAAGDYESAAMGLGPLVSPGAGEAEGGGGGNISQGAMQGLYYGINPPRHAEKAYQASDGSPPLHPRPTTVGKSGRIVALVTSIYNRPPFGREAQFSICDRGGKVLYTGTAKTPSKIDVAGLDPGLEVLVRPETVGTMVKLLTPEQIAGEEEPAAGKAAAGEESETGEGGGNMSQGAMQGLYYGINPPRHAEKAYQASDGAPPLHPRPTRVGKSGTIVALVTSLYNKPPFGKEAQFSICDRGGKVLYTGKAKTPSKIEVPSLTPGMDVLVRPETVGTMVKLLTPEQIAGAEEAAAEQDKAKSAE